MFILPRGVKREFLFILTVIALTLLLAGCGGGGGGGGSPSPGAQPPPLDPSGSREVVNNLPPDYNDLEYIPGTPPADTGSVFGGYEGGQQYGIMLIGAHHLHWATHNGVTIRGAGVTVGIIDSGIDTDHDDLSANILAITNAAIKMENIEDQDGHGTQVAGIIAARLNARGVVGVAPEARLLALHVIEGDDDTRVKLDSAYDYMSANHAFVVNNSWSREPYFMLVSVKANALTDTDGNGLAPGRYWLHLPAYEREEGGTLRKAADSMLLVFASGNEGWNAETGQVYYCREDNDICDSKISLADSPGAAVITVYDRADYDEIGTPATISLTRPKSLPARVITTNLNFIGAIARIPADYPEEALNWLNVVAVDNNRQIAGFSNGCGVMKARCLAAPGVDIETTDRGETNLETVVSGTSFAAPHVSGAAALLKGAFPNLSPAQVAAILLESADGLGSCKGDDKKTTCIDKVYGHGILNVSAAFTPVSFISLAATPSGNGAAVKSGFSLAESRIQLSPVFGAAPWRGESLDIGGLDNYGRVFYTRLDFSEGVVVSKPLVGEDGKLKRAGLHRAYAPPLSQPAAAAAYIAGEALESAQWRQSGQALSYGMSRALRRQSHFVALRPGDSRLTWRYRNGGGEQETFSAGYWQAPFDQGAVHQLQWDYPPAAVAMPQVGVMLGSGSGVRQTAARLQWQVADWNWTAEGGIVREADRVLGASFTGAFSVREVNTVYRRWRGVYRPADGLHLFADYTRSASEADGSGGIVRRLDARADAWEAGLETGRWRFIISQPLAVTSGGLDLSYISGYTAAGDYAVTRKRLDISSGRRARRASLLYVREPIDGLSFALGLDVWRHAPSRGYAGDAVALSGALRYRF